MNDVIDTLTLLNLLYFGATWAVRQHEFLYRIFKLPRAINSRILIGSTQ